MHGKARTKSPGKYVTKRAHPDKKNHDSIMLRLAILQDIKKLSPLLWKRA
jgi:hypothetical protein